MSGETKGEQPKPNQPIGEWKPNPDLYRRLRNATRTHEEAQANAHKFAEEVGLLREKYGILDLVVAYRIPFVAPKDKKNPRQVVRGGFTNGNMLDALKLIDIEKAHILESLALANVD